MNVIIATIGIYLSSPYQIPAKDTNSVTSRPKSNGTATEVPWCGKGSSAFWVERLRAVESTDRQDAALALGLLGDSGGPAVRALVLAVDDPDASVAVEAVMALGRIGREASAAVPTLAAKLGDARYYLPTRGLGLRGDNAPVARALARIGEPATATLMQVLTQRGRDGAREQAAFALSLMGRGAKSAVPILIKSINDDNFWVSGYAIEALGRIGPDARESIPSLEAAFNDIKFEYNRDKLVRALTKLGAPPLAALRKAIIEKQYLDVAVLGGAGIEPDVTVPVLIKALKDKDYEVRVQAFDALGCLGPAAATAIPALLDYLNSDGRIEAFEAEALGRIGEAARPAIPLMLEFCRKENAADDAPYVFRAIPKIDPSGLGAVRPLVDLLREGNAPFREEICAALGQIGPGAAPAVPALIDIVKGAGDDVRAEAIAALGRIGPAAAPAIPILIDTVQKSDSGTLIDAIIALGRIGPAAAVAIPALITRVTPLRETENGRDRALRVVTIVALGRLGPAAASTTVLTDLLKHGVPFDPETVMSLVRIDHAGAAAIEAVVEERMRKAPASIRERVLVAAALNKECPEVENFLDLLLSQLEDVLGAEEDYNPLAWIGCIRFDLDLLQSLGRAAKREIPRLTRLGRSQHALINRWIKETIQELSGEDPLKK